jgi:hypothetical protein
VKLFRVSLLLSLSLLALGASATEFTQADLEKMVVELDRVLPENPNYKYPVHCSVEENDQVNAYATYVKEGADKRAKMVVYTGLVKGVQGDLRLVRAVVAHELSHLSRGHSLDINPKARDLNNLWTRQQEYEADKYGAEALVKCGYSKKDMVDLMLFFDALQGRKGDWLDNLTADHADPKARAAEVSDNPAALKALVTFDIALAYEDARSHLYAKKLFDLSAAQWPALTEAHINAGMCALLFYYDNLPPAVRAKWWRPDFGPLLTTPHAPLPRAVVVTDKDRQAWKDAMAAIEIAVTKNPGSEEAKALQAIGRVLQPDAIKDVVDLGINWFVAQAAATKDPKLKLRYANNAAVGYHQLGDLKTAYHTIIDAQRGSTVFNAALGENMGLVRVAGRSKEDDKLAADVIFTWLCNTPAGSPSWPTVKKTFDDICSTAGINAKEVKAKPGYLCQVVTLVSNNFEIGLLLPAPSIKKLLGDPQQIVTFTDKWPDLTEMRWADGTLSVLTERDKVMRLTSYQDNAFLELKPVDRTSQTKLRVRVGMSKGELFSMLDETSAELKDLAKGGKVEVWHYFPALGMGVLIDGDKVKGITVTPVVYEED